MAVRHASGGYLERYTSGSTDGIPQSGGGTICGWFNRVVDRGASTCLILLRGEGTTGHYAGVYTTEGSFDRLKISSTWGDTSEISAYSDVPVFVALTFDGTTCSIYASNLSTAGFTGGSLTMTTDPQFNMVRVGDDSYGAWFNGESCGVMAWDRVLSASELNVQLRHRTPVNRAGLLFWLPEIDASTASNNAIDHSGNGRNFNVIGSPTAAAGLSFNWALNR